MPSLIIFPNPVCDPRETSHRWTQAPRKSYAVLKSALRGPQKVKSPKFGSRNSSPLRVKDSDQKAEMRSLVALGLLVSIASATTYGGLRGGLPGVGGWSAVSPTDSEIVNAAEVKKSISVCIRVCVYWVLCDAHVAAKRARNCHALLPAAVLRVRGWGPWRGMVRLATGFYVSYRAIRSASETVQRLLRGESETTGLCSFAGMLANAVTPSQTADGVARCCAFCRPDCHSSTPSPTPCTPSRRYES